VPTPALDNRRHQQHAAVRTYWARRRVAEWLVARLGEEVPTRIGIDHGFSFPLRYFELHQLETDCPDFLYDFHRHWPTDDEVYVDFVDDGTIGDGAAHQGNTRWRPVTDERAGGAKLVFYLVVYKFENPKTR